MEETIGRWDLIIGAMFGGCLVILTVLLVWDGYRYPMCPTCGTNEHVRRNGNRPTCTLHGDVPRQDA
ncbi:hypothetical protein HY632_05070 [Candidatus Uhrbacteria bacterium]|nr:hypothetical protein [Candidatus Uhrbacteria bacterium]